MASDAPRRWATEFRNQLLESWKILVARRLVEVAAERQLFHDLTALKRMSGRRCLNFLYVNRHD